VNASDQISLFYSYAHVDATLRDELDKHLSLLRQGGFIAQWYDRNISAGTDWVDQIDQHLNTAHIILLLISSDFLASTYCYSIEMKSALERHKAGEARVIPILLRPVDWQDAPFAKLQVLPQNASPVTTWTDRDLAFRDIAIQLRKVVKELQESQINTSSHQQELLQSNNLQAPLRSRANEQTDGDPQQGHVSSHILQGLSEFRRCQKKVNELKSVHNMLHEIEVQLEGLSAAIQLFTRGEREKKKSPRKWPILLKREINLLLSDLEYIEIAWRQAVLKIDDLVYFATEVMETLEDERFSLDSDVVRGGAPWVKELFILQRAFETKIRERDMNGVKNLSGELLTKCRTHLYRIDKRLLDAVKELDLSSDLIIRYRT